MRASGYARAVADYYVEPASCVDALIAAERPFAGLVLDPCCGGGNIVRRLKSAGVKARGADIASRWDQAVVQDYRASLAAEKPTSVVSNPPYGEAQEFVETALRHTADRVCVLLRLAFLEGQKRREFFGRTPLARVWISSKRLSMPPGGTDVKASGGTVAYGWYVWEDRHVGPPVLGWLP